MSTAQMTPAQAYETLHRRVAVPAFFNKLASFGIRPKDDAEANEMLKTAGKLRTLWDANQQDKQAATGSLLTKLSSAADRALAERGLLSQPAATTVEGPTAEMRKVAASVALDPELAASVLALVAAQPAA